MTLEETRTTPDALVAEARRLLAAGRPGEALRAAEHALGSDPRHPGALAAAGLACFLAGDPARAERFLRQAADADPLSPTSQGNLAGALFALRDLDGAAARLERAAALAADTGDRVAAARYGSALARVCHWRGDDDAAARIEAAARADPANPAIRYDLGIAYLARGRFREGWQLFEARLEADPRIYRRWHATYRPERRWAPGQGLGGRRLALWNPYGFGDAFQFLRLVPEIRRRWDCSVSLHCRAEAVRLLRRSGLGIDDFVTADPESMAAPPPHDAHAPIMSLPCLLGLDAVPPWPGPYLAADPADLGPSDRLRVGVCHAGNPGYPDDRRRSIPLRWFRGLHDLTGVELHDLTRGPRVRRYPGATVDLLEGAGGLRLVDCEGRTGDWAETAALVKALDLVVSSDTAVLHLAGALGVPAVGLLHRPAEWRWGLAGDRTPWYPSVRLLRQEAPGDWAPVFQQLEALVRERLTRWVPPPGP